MSGPFLDLNPFWRGVFAYILISGLLITIKIGPLFSVPVNAFQSVEVRISPLGFGQIEKPLEKQK